MDKSIKPIINHITDFLDWLDIEKGLSNKSQENYSRFLKKFCEWLKKNNLKLLLPHQLTPEHIFKYKTFLARQTLKQGGQPLKRTTQNYYLIALRSLLTYFADKDIISLPADKIKLAKRDKERTVSFLSLDQLNKLFDGPNIKTTTGLRDRAILEVLFSTGLRVAELVALDRQQIKLNAREKELEIGIIGKGGYSRTIYISQRALEWLKRYLEGCDPDQRPLFVNYKGKGSGGRLTTRSIERLVKKYVIMAGLPINTSPHTLRHSFATDLLVKGADLRVVQEFLGHRNIVTTQIYTHVTRPQLREIHQKLHSGSADQPL
ncbi:MAG: tyrosine-type recombinase/integrase [Candidatus Paceibacterota bacterium]|jgi:site-specific recombinase XerD